MADEAPNSLPGPHSEQLAPKQDEQQQEEQEPALAAANSKKRKNEEEFTTHSGATDDKEDGPSRAADAEKKRKIATNVAQGGVERGIQDTAPRAAANGNTSPKTAETEATQESPDSADRRRGHGSNSKVVNHRRLSTADDGPMGDRLPSEPSNSYGNTSDGQGAHNVVIVPSHLAQLQGIPLYVPMPDDAKRLTPNQFRFVQNADRLATAIRDGCYIGNVEDVLASYSGPLARRAVFQIHWQRGRSPLTPHEESSSNYVLVGPSGFRMFPGFRPVHPGFLPPARTAAIFRLPDTTWPCKPGDFSTKRAIVEDQKLIQWLQIRQRANVRPRNAMVGPRLQPNQQGQGRIHPGSAHNAREPPVAGAAFPSGTVCMASPSLSQDTHAGLRPIPHGAVQRRRIPATTPSVERTSPAIAAPAQGLPDLSPSLSQTLQGRASASNASTGELPQQLPRPKACANTACGKAFNISIITCESCYNSCYCSEACRLSHSMIHAGNCQREPNARNEDM